MTTHLPAEPGDRYADRPFDAASLSEMAFIEDTDNWLKLA
jgi:hypothetical protein